MADEALAGHRARSRKRLLRRWWLWAIVGLIVAVAAASSWVAVRGLSAKSELEAAQALIPQMKAQALAFDVPGARATLDEVAARSAAAAELTSDPIWALAEGIPFAGVNLTAVRELTAVIQSTLNDVAEPLLTVAESVSPASLAPKGGAVDIAPLQDAITKTEEANEGIRSAVAALNEIDTGGTIPEIAEAQAKVSGLLNDLEPVVEQLNGLLPLMPAVLGAEGPRRYVVMFQNNAESRALGGAALAFAVVSVDQGRIRLLETIPAQGRFVQYPQSVLPEPDGARDLYAGAYGTYIANVTVRPHFPSAAELTQEMWLRTFGHRVDGIVSIDPVALGYLLRATDPIPIATGDILDSSSLVPLLLNGIYQRFDTGDNAHNNELQDAVYAQAVTATVDRLTSGPLDPKLFIAAVTQGWEERRLLVYSAHEMEQNKLAEFGFDGGLPTSDAEVERVGLYFQDNVGSKLNFYLNQSVRVAQAECSPDGRQSYRVSADLTNALPPELVGTLSESILGTWGREGVNPGEQRVIVMLYAPPGSSIVAASVNGMPEALVPFHDEQYPVGRLRVTIPPGGTWSVSFDVLAPEPGRKELEATITPMVNPTAVVTEELDCDTVPLG